MKPSTHQAQIKKSGRRQAEPDFFHNADLIQDSIAMKPSSGTENPRAMCAAGAKRGDEQDRLKELTGDAGA
jgi:hypothetical protein